MSAVEKFNRAFDKQFREPMSADGLEKLADFARLRGRDDIAVELELQLDVDLKADLTA